MTQIGCARQEKASRLAVTIDSTLHSTQRLRFALHHRLGDCARSGPHRGFVCGNRPGPKQWTRFRLTETVAEALKSNNTVNAGPACHEKDRSFRGSGRLSVELSITVRRALQGPDL